jgi:predicted  nucleic acid-binding Zn-ribbon protein
MVYIKRSRKLLDAVTENSQLLIAVGAIISFLIIGTVVGFAVNRVLGKLRSSPVLSIRKNMPLTSGSELKSYLHSLEFEKNLTAESLTRVAEAMNQGKISPLEYDRLVLQYNEKLQTFEKEISELRSTSDIFELQNLRNDLNSFLQNKMKQIDEKLGQLSKNETHIGSRPPTLFKKFATAANRENKVQIQKPYHFFSRRTQSFKDQEKKIEDTQKEIMIALERLESKGLDEKQARVQTSNKKNKDALASFEKR